MLIAIIVLFGSISLSRLGLDMMPDLEFPMLTVATAYPGAAAEDVEQLVTRPIESVVSSIKGIEKITSTSAEGLSTVMVEFKWGSNLDFAGQDIRESISRIRRMLPDNIIDPMVMKFDMSQMPVLMYGISGMNSPMELQKYFEDAIVPRIERVDGVASMMVMGAPAREINVFLNKTRLDQYRIGPDAVMGVLGASNTNVSGGHVTAGHQEYMVRVMGEFTSIDDISNTIITTVNGSPIRIRDVAHVEDTQRERRGFMRLNGKDGVVMMVMKQSGTNTLSTVKGIRAALEELRPFMPADIQYMTIFDQGEMIENVTGNTAKTAVTGGFIAVIVLWLFLRNWRPTVIITLAIPISIVTTFIGLYLFGYTLNIITLGGFALVVGMLIDNAVVVIENIYRHLEDGSHRNEAAINGASEVGLAIAASTFTTVAVFVPLTLAGGFAGKISQPLAITICLGLCASLLVATTIVPMFASVLFKKRKSKNPEAEVKGGKIFTLVQTNYEKAVTWVLNHRAITMLVTLVLFALTIGGFAIVGGEFMADGDNGMGTMTVKLPVGTNAEETNRLVSTIEERFLATPEVRSVAAMVGRLSEESGRSSNDVNEAQIFFRLTSLDERTRSMDEITGEWRKALPELHDVVIEIGSGGMMGGSANPIELKFFGTDITALKAYADSAKAIMERMEGLHDIQVSMREGKPELRIIPDRDRASMMGFTMAEIGMGLRYANFGQVVSTFKEAGEEYDIRIRLDESDRATRDNVTSIPVVSRTGVVTQVGNLGEISYVRGPTEINRENRVRVITVSAKIDGRDVQSAMARVQAEMKEIETSLPHGYFIEYGGSFEDMQKTFKDLILALVIAIVLIYMVMAAQFESFTQPFIVMFTVPLAFIGVVIGLMVMGHPLSVPAFLGVIILVGIVLNNGIVMIDYVNQLRAKGLPIKEALIKGATIRLRPILITSVSTIFALMPMTFSGGQGAEMYGPMGAVTMFGLTTSMFLTLLVLPVIYSIVDGVAHGITSFLKMKVLGETHRARH
jgi:HAE1 family hydrophobic/amphiphilic exporter-1